MTLDVSFVEAQLPALVLPSGVINGGGVVSGAAVPAPITGRVTARPVPGRAVVGLPALLMSREQLVQVMARGVSSRRAVGKPMVQADNRWVVKMKGIGRRTV